MQATTSADDRPGRATSSETAAGPTSIGVNAPRIPGMRDAVLAGMATTVATTDEVITEDLITKPERRVIASPIGWGAIFAAAFVAGGVWLLLHLFGIAIGLTAIDPHDRSSLHSVGMGTGVWSLIAPVIALFVGGLVAGRIAPTINTLNAAIHGAVTWALTMLATFTFVFMMLGAMLGAMSRTAIQVRMEDINTQQHMSANASQPEEVPQKALEAAEAAGPVVLTLSFVLLASLGAAVFGAIAAVRHERHTHVLLPRATTRAVTSSP